MVADLSPQKFSQRAVDVGLIEPARMKAAWAQLGSSDVTLDELTNHLIRQDMLTNYQVERIISGERFGFFYGRYRTLYLIGTGTFARVYRSVHEESGRIVAVKVLRKRYREDFGEREQFLREGRMGLDLNHPNVVPIYEVTGDRIPYMVMEFVEGQTLRQMVKVRGKLDVGTSLKLLHDILSGLAHAAEKGITHRDLKMSNVLISALGRAKLVDFGLAAASTVGDELADCPNARAIDYAALERGTGVRKDDPRSDIFFAGCVAYTMFTGKTPLAETRDRIQRLSFARFQAIPTVNYADPTLPAIIVALVQKAMELNPEKRFNSPAAMLAEVRRVIQRLKQGDQGAWAPQGADDRQVGSPVDASGETSASEAQEGENRTVMVVESQSDLQDVLREKLKQRGYRVLITNNPERAVERFRDADDKLPANCVLFSCIELGTSSLDAFNALGRLEKTRSLPAILFADQRQEALISQADLSENRVLLTAPLKVRELRAALLKLLRASAPTAEA